MPASDSGSLPVRSGADDVDDADDGFGRRAGDSALQLHNFSKDEYKLRHPGGKLGK